MTRRTATGRRRPRGEPNLTPTLIAKVRARWALGDNIDDIADDTHLSTATVSAVARRLK